MQDEKKQSREEYLYHNTEVLLKKYRDVVWSIDVSTLQAQVSFELEMDCKLEEFLEMSYEAGANFTGTHIHEQMRSMERNKKMLKIIEAAVNIMRKHQRDGEEFYWILYYTYLSDKPCKRIEDTIRKIEEKTESMAWKTYFNRRRKAIEILSTILWGFTSKECKSILEQFVEE